LPDTPNETNDEWSKEELEKPSQHSESNMTGKIFWPRFKTVTTKLTQDTDPCSETLE
jgi:hypothetical protein